jgi:hypothetical protein
MARDRPGLQDYAGQPAPAGLPGWPTDGNGTPGTQAATYSPDTASGLDSAGGPGTASGPDTTGTLDTAGGFDAAALAPVPVAPRADARPGPADPVPVPRSRHGGTAGRPSRAQTRQTFTELASLAAISRDAYAVDEAVDGAICLIRTEHGFEVFSAAEGTRHEVRVFDDEETAYFYLFGLLAAEAVRDGRLIPPPVI